jgi:BASS family bile acid:Na+ symporter
MKSLLGGRNGILILALILGLLWGKGAQWSERITLPALALVMTLATMGISGKAFSSPRIFLSSALAGIVMSYLILGAFLLGLSHWIVRDEALRAGFVLIAAVPPAVAVIPFTYFLNGDGEFSLVATIGAYLGALMITPLIILGWLGIGNIDPTGLFIILIELVLAPLVFSRILNRTGISSRLDPFKGTVINWSFFLLTYTIVGLNRELILGQPLSLLPVALIAVGSTFFMGGLIEIVGNWLKISPKKIMSLILLGTLKNYGLAGGLALALFSKKTSAPATVSAVFMMVYIIWLEIKTKRNDPRISLKREKADP